MENLKTIQNKVNTINKGYTCNFNYKGTGMNFVNGANTLCFTIVNDNVKFHTVGGSRFFYNDITVEEFIKMMPSMLLTIDECNNVYRKIAGELLENS